jgi:hypothetical protein
MPIRPENKKHYTARSGWPLIRLAVMVQAARRCEWGHGSLDWCAAPDRSFVRWVGEKWEALTNGELDAMTSEGERPVLIVLTVAHLNQDPTDNRRSNLKALCQRHHNRLDAKFRAAGIRSRRHAKAGQEELL